MVYITTAPTTSITEAAATDAQTGCTSTLDTALKTALEHARRLTDLFGTDSTDVAIAWETVEELRSAKADTIFRPKDPVQSAFERYCLENPDAPECRIYDN